MPKIRIIDQDQFGTLVLVWRRVSYVKQSEGFTIGLRKQLKIITTRQLR